MKLALLTAAVNGDNSGDAIIESAVTRLVPAGEVLRFPLTSPLGDEELAAINGCDALIICGTNLYQHVFACNLTAAVVERICIPVIPFGIGSSAAIGAIPKMNREGVDAVRAIHRKCVVSGVRDEASLRFLRSIGVDNVVLSGCPVLFHGLGCPDFTPSGEGYTLTPRARLLHIEDAWNARQRETLEFLCRRYHPSVVLQSPYDIPVAEDLAHKYGVEILMDPAWQAGLYLDIVRRQQVNLGFRLHFAMLSIAYGKPAYLVSHDSRAAEFCKLVGLPLLDIRNYSDHALARDIDARVFDADRVRRNWDALSVRMAEFLAANGLPSALVPAAAVPAVNDAVRPKPRRKPRILMLVDVKGWAFDISARKLARALGDRFEFDIRYVKEQPSLDPSRYDLLYVFFWGETWHQQFGFAPERTIKEVSSHRWEDPLYGSCTPEEMVSSYLGDAGTVICTSLRLTDLVKPFHPRVRHTPNGFSHVLFHRDRERTGPLTIGWAGNVNDEVKGYRDILEPACRDRFRLLAAGGALSHGRMNRFYNKLDVLAVCSRHEGEPLPLLEAMAAGCFPVCTDVGIVPELVQHGVNGLIVSERTPEAFAEAFAWCEANLDRVREAGRENARLLRRERNWEVCASSFGRVFDEVYEEVSRPRFRNDDVSWDTSLPEFRRFCGVFHKHGLRQVHGVTLRGCTNTMYRHGDTPVEYEGYDTVANLENGVIRTLSTGRFEERRDLIDYLNTIPDEIALHGLYHTDYSRMTAEEQREDIEAGLLILRRLFPEKRIAFFIAPFNRTNDATFEVCREFGLQVLSADGVHLESVLPALELERETWYRYHHHRFYPESVFSYYDLSVELLDAALARAVARYQARPVEKGGLVTSLRRLAAGLAG
ncbi:polysaccharide pyruvyl transferase family protein [Geomonas subterranea]|uniref:Polysaccharide pyruvyl transferase family protein n=1 Tax=Geomonas subterranea TaxID=2847989 RepID=A0ABX8LJX4_9BACT|nr:polysaccharide pyruvyl transferase family protein [Geomonas subterranea]QXE92331.1 polysaccharide pyruvyl transferase family protein [Geomonas subterranea]QXM09570.1 polysaccharide pyruvyl transferase family protein [Geomonas subterranea]